MHTHMRRVRSHANPGSHPPSTQVPPQPSLDPHGASAAQNGVQVHVMVIASQRSKRVGQAPTQRPPQPSSAPQAPPATQVRSH